MSKLLTALGLLLAAPASAQSIGTTVQVHFVCQNANSAMEVATELEDAIPGITSLPADCRWLSGGVQNQAASIEEVIAPIALDNGNIVYVARVQREGKNFQRDYFLWGWYESFRYTEKEAERAYLISKLSDHDAAILSESARIDLVIEKFKKQKVELQDLCSHPLIARETENRGSSEHWDGDSSYWTDHRCGLCGRRWSTTQRWEYVGSHLGLPDDGEARNWEN